MKKTEEVLQRHLAGGFRSKGAKLCKVASGFDHEGGFVALAAMGNGSQIGAVRFEEKAVKRNHGCSVSNVLRFRVADVSGKGEHKAEIE